VKMEHSYPKGQVHVVQAEWYGFSAKRRKGISLILDPSAVSRGLEHGVPCSENFMGCPCTGQKRHIAGGFLSIQTRASVFNQGPEEWRLGGAGGHDPANDLQGAFVHLQAGSS